MRGSSKRPRNSTVFPGRGYPGSGGAEGSGGTAEGGSGLPAELGGEGGNEIDDMIDMNKVEGRVRSSNVKKIGEIVERHTEEAVGILRNWIYQES